MTPGTAISAIAHAALLAWGLVSFSARPLDVPPVDSILTDVISESEFSRLTAGVKTAPPTPKQQPLVDKVGETKPPPNDVVAKASDKPEIQTPTATPPPPPPPPPPPAQTKPDSATSGRGGDQARSSATSRPRRGKGRSEEGRARSDRGSAQEGRGEAQGGGEAEAGRGEKAGRGQEARGSEEARRRETGRGEARGEQVRFRPHPDRAARQAYAAAS